MAGRTILHVDLDAFYAAVEVRENPALAGRPVIVGADPRGGRGRGVVCAASYEARAFGVHSAMPISQAFRRCPGGVYLRPRMEHYVAVSQRFMAILQRFTDQVEPLSIDEAFLDVTGSRRAFGCGRTVARKIRAAVREEEELTASVGVAPSKFVAKIASDLDKPDGLVAVDEAEVLDFLEQLPVRRLFGAGPRTQQRLQAIGVVTIGDVGRVPREQLAAVLSPGTADHLQELARGRDPRPVDPDRERKSLGREMTFGQDVADRDIVARNLLQLVDEVTAGLRRRSLVARTVTVKLRDADFQTVSRRHTLGAATDTTAEVWPIARRLLRLADQFSLPIRLVGVHLSQLAGRQRELFESGTVQPQRRIDQALDQITERFGQGSVVRGRLVRPPRPRPGGEQPKG